MKQVESLTEAISYLQNVFIKKGYSFFTKGEFNLNIIGVRRKYNPDKFSDYILVIYRDYLSRTGWVLDCYNATTYPGKEWLQKPMTPEGCAVIKEGQYKGAYSLGLHFGIESLVQIGGPVSCYRDNDKNTDITLDEKSIISGYFGINIHPCMDGDNNRVGLDSAGCQVFQHRSDFNRFIDTIKKSLRVGVYGRKFTYTLISEDDIPEVIDNLSGISISTYHANLL